MKCLETELLVDDVVVAYSYRCKHKKKIASCILKHHVRNVADSTEIPANASKDNMLNAAEDLLL